MCAKDIAAYFGRRDAAMGDLGRDALCYFCFTKKAGYILDGHPGPICMGLWVDYTCRGYEDSCYAYLERQGPEALEVRRLALKWRGHIVKLTRNHYYFSKHVLATQIASFLW